MVTFKLVFAFLSCVGTFVMAAPIGGNTGGAYGDQTVVYYSSETSGRIICYVSAANEKKLHGRLATMPSFKQITLNGSNAWAPRAYPADAGESVFIALCQMYDGNSNAIGGQNVVFEKQAKDLNGQ